MAGKIIADQIEGTTTTETVGGASVTIPNVIDTRYVVNGSAKAWANMDGDAATPVFRDSLNCSTLTDTAAGTINPQFTSNMSNSNFVSVGCAHASGVAWCASVYVGGKTTSQMHFQTRQVDNTNAVDADPADIASFGDLA